MGLFNIYLEEKTVSVIAVFPGRFQPFHKGHLDIYKKLIEKFGKTNIYIITGDNLNSKNKENNPLNFKQKKELIASVGIPKNRIIKMKGSAYNIDNIFSSLKKNKKDFKLIVCFSEKDLGIKNLGKTYKPFKNISLMKTADKNGYIYLVPVFKNFNASDIRKRLKKNTLKGVLNKIPENPEYLRLLKNFFNITE